MKTTSNSELKVVSIRLVPEPSWFSREKLNTPEEVAMFLSEELSQYDRELFCILNLDTKNHVINMNIASMGTLNASLVSPREVFKSSILSNAASVILAHNHPSFDVTPSKDDILVSKRLIDAGEIIGISVLDHIIVGAAGKYLSMREKQLGPFTINPTVKAERISEGRPR